MTTDAMREKFEAWLRTERKDYSLEYINDRYTYTPPQRAWEAYQQGQRDLMEAMGEPVAWQISYPSEPDLGHWIAEGKCSDLDSIPLYRLPEDTPK